MSRHFPKYVSVGERKKQADQRYEALRKKCPGIRRVEVTGRSLACTWWGRAWNHNLERYADYANRIDRGKRYLRQGSVLDLTISPGTVTALVLGSRLAPYEVMLTIRPLSGAAWQRLVARAEGKVDSMDALISGAFPDALSSLLMEQDRGLFPHPDEIALSCSCPDWATMCKHVAATLYAVGVRLDEDPSLLFTLRNVGMKALVSETVRSMKDRLVASATGASGRFLDRGEDLSALFGICIALPDEKNPPAAPGTSAAPDSRKPHDATDRLVLALKGYPEGRKVADLIREIDLPSQKIRNRLSIMKRNGIVTSPKRGVYRLSR